MPVVFERTVAESSELAVGGSDQAQCSGKGAPKVSEESGVLSAHFAKLCIALNSLHFFFIFLVSIPEN